MDNQEVTNEEFLNSLFPELATAGDNIGAVSNRENRQQRVNQREVQVDYANEIASLQRQIEDIRIRESTSVITQALGGVNRCLQIMQSDAVRYEHVTPQVKDKLVATNSRFENFYGNNYTNGPRSIPGILSLDTICCNFRCNWKLTTLDVLLAREFLPIKEHGVMDIKKVVGAIIMQDPRIGLYINGHLVCNNLFSWIYFLPLRWIEETLERKERGQRTLPLDLRSIGKTVHQTTLDRQATLYTFTKNVCDPSPTAPGLMVPPHYSRSTFVNEGLNERLTDGSLKVHSTRTAKNVIKKMSINLQFDCGNNLPKCDICSKLKTAGDKTYMINGQAVTAKQMLKNHRENIMADRLWESRATAESMEFPNQLLVVKIDGFSKGKTALPSLYSLNAKKIANVHGRVDYHLHAAVVCRNAPESVIRGYINAYFVPSSLDSNRIISLFYDTLLHVDIIPPKIIIMCDNAFVNKGKKVIFALARMFQYLPSIDSIVIASFPVGHTHNEVDAFFGIVSKKVYGKDIVIPAEMLATVNEIRGVRMVKDDFSVWGFEEGEGVPAKIVQGIHYTELFKAEDGIRIRIKKYIRANDFIDLNARLREPRGVDRFSRLVIQATAPIIYPRRMRVSYDHVRNALTKLDKKGGFGRLFPSKFIDFQEWVLEKEAFVPEELSNIVRQIQQKTIAFIGLAGNLDDAFEENLREFVAQLDEENDQLVNDANVLGQNAVEDGTDVMTQPAATTETQEEEQMETNDEPFTQPLSFPSASTEQTSGVTQMDQSRNSTLLDQDPALNQSNQSLNDSLMDTASVVSQSSNGSRRSTRNRNPTRMLIYNRKGEPEFSTYKKPKS